MVLNPLGCVNALEHAHEPEGLKGHKDDSTYNFQMVYPLENAHSPN